MIMWYLFSHNPTLHFKGQLTPSPEAVAGSTEAVVPGDPFQDSLQAQWLAVCVIPAERIWHTARGVRPHRTLLTHCVDISSPCTGFSNHTIQDAQRLTLAEIYLLSYYEGISIGFNPIPSVWPFILTPNRQYDITFYFDSIPRATLDMLPAEVILHEVTRLALAHGVLRGRARFRHHLIIPAQLAVQAPPQVVPLLRVVLRWAGGALRLLGGAAVLHHVRPRGTTFARELEPAGRVSILIGEDECCHAPAVPDDHHDL